MEDWILLVGSSALAIGIALVIAGARRLIAHQRETKRIRDIFARYFPPAIVDDLLSRRDPDIFRGRAGRATILVCRIWNFANVLEGRTPADALKYLNEFYTIAGQSIQKYNGMIDKFLGDGITAVFGMPPLEETGQEQHAVRAAIDIVRLVNGMDARWKAENRRPLHVGIGINSGVIIAGDIGFEGRREFTVIGPEAELASRLEEHTEELNAYILATKSTIDPVRDKFDVLPFENVPLRGMRKVREVYVVRGIAAQEEDALARPHPEDFKETTVTDGRLRRPAEKTPAKPAAGQGASKVARPRVAPPKNKQVIDVPELRAPRIRRTDDAEPAMPDVPLPPVLYEDKDGPIALPP